MGEGKRHKNRMQMKRSAYGLRLPTPKVVNLKFDLTVIQTADDLSNMLFLNERYWASMILI